MVAAHASALRALKLLFIDAGTRDEWSLDLGARVLARRLTALGVPFEHQEFDDGHRSSTTATTCRCRRWRRRWGPT